MFARVWRAIRRIFPSPGRCIRCGDPTAPREWICAACDKAFY